VSASPSPSEAGPDLRVELSLDYVTYKGTTQCKSGDENSSGTLLAIGVAPDGDICEEYNTDGDVTFIKIKITCDDVRINRSYYQCDIGDNDCSDCQEEAYLQTFDENFFNTWLKPSWGQCYGEVEKPNKLSSSKFVAGFEDYWDPWFGFLMKNSCIGDYD